MSFTSDIKQELNKSSNLANKELVVNELIGYLITNNISFINLREIRFATESDYNINRFSKLLSNLNIDHKIDIIGKAFTIIIRIRDLIEKVDIDIDARSKEIILKSETITKIAKEKDKEEKFKNIIKGNFLGSGYMNNPEKKYHLEINFSNETNLKNIVKILKEFGINIKTMKTENKYSVYLKDSEEISKILALIGVNKAVMKFEEIRIEREMRSKVNRLVNCETANLNKTLNAAIEQISAIDKLEKSGKYNMLDENLKEIAILRKENPDMPLQELGKLLKNPVGKSGVNYRLKKIIEIANDM